MWESWVKVFGTTTSSFQLLYCSASIPSCYNHCTAQIDPTSVMYVRKQTGGQTDNVAEKFKDTVHWFGFSHTHRHISPYLRTWFTKKWMCTWQVFLSRCQLVEHPRAHYISQPTNFLNKTTSTQLIFASSTTRQHMEWDFNSCSTLINNQQRSFVLPWPSMTNWCTSTTKRM